MASAALSQDEIAEQFARDGALCIKGLLSPAELVLIRRAWDWSRSHPGPCAMPPDGPANFYQDVCNPANAGVYRDLCARTGIPALVARLFGGGQVWFLHEQIFHKEGAHRRPTPMHQDTAYWTYTGAKLAAVWISLDPVAEGEALEFALGSHKGELFAPVNQDGSPLFDRTEMKPAPDKEALRTRWRLASWPTEPGDVVVFHHAILHGGGSPAEGKQRRTLSLRFFGDDVVRMPLGGAFAEESPDPTQRLLGLLSPGERLSNVEAFFQVYPPQA